MKTNELTGAALNWAVAKCEGHEIDSLMGGAVWYWLKCSLTGALEVVEVFTPSTDWAHGGPIIEREGINLFQRKGLAAKAGNPWLAYNEKQLEAAGPTPLIAAMRCYVTAKLGDNIELPKELT